MKTEEKIAYALKRISELELLITFWRKSQDDSGSKTARSD